MQIIKSILMVIYWLASVWAFHYLFEGWTLFGSIDRIFVIKWLFPLIIGPIIIPIAILKCILSSIF